MAGEVPATTSVEQALLRAARRILRPLVRVMLRNGITAYTFQELVRKVFVDVAHDEFGIEGKPQTLARVSVITGLNRKEVARLRKMPALDESDRTFFNRAGTVFAAWRTDDAFHDAKGDPLDLPFSDGSPSFSDLVRKHSGDMYPRAIADELLRLGAIAEVDGKLRMTQRGYVPVADAARMIDIMGVDTGELIETIDHNLQATADAERRLQIKVLANNLPEAQFAEFDRYSKRIARNALEEIARWLQERDLGRDNSGHDRRLAVGVGMFQIVHVVREASEPEQSQETDADDV